MREDFVYQEKKVSPTIKRVGTKIMKGEREAGKDHSKWWKGQNGKPKSYVEENSRKYHGELYLRPKKSVVVCEPR